jgi:hypothetical protein
MTEADVQNLQRLQASQRGWRVWRNNRGVLRNPDTGQPVRFGLANDNPSEAKQYASADLIGCAPTLILPEHVGHTLGLFLSIEVKASDVTRVPVAQRNWQTLVRSLGGYAIITNGEREL